MVSRQNVAAIIINNYGGDALKAYRVADMIIANLSANENWHGKATNGECPS